ncbi:MAG: ribonuclease H family protein [Bacteroidales bacterium]|nr:ribonuclease H family protein [Bacteroidales bacterium]
MANNKKKYYVVWKGRNTGVFYSWDECKAQVDKYQGALYKSYENEDEAFEALKKGASPRFVSNVAKKVQAKQAAKIPSSQIIQQALAVDAACSGNPGDMEYRGVYVQTGQEIFRMGPFPEGTNNIGEFLAIVHGLSLLKQKGLNIPLYSDSKIAMGWIAQKKCKTKLEVTEKNKPLFNLIQRAENWLVNNSYTTPIYKWETKSWGEIPADFGRK